MNKERLKYCRYYTGDNSFETDKKVPFDKMYMMYAEKYYVNGEEDYSREETYAVELFKDAGLMDLVTPDLPLELLAQLFAIHNRNVQRASWTLEPIEHVAKSFRNRYLPKYLSGRVGN